MALILITAALVAVYILLRVSGNNRSPITPILPNPTLSTRRMKINRSTSVKPFHLFLAGLE
jgi:hypothetical protein